MAKKIFNFDLDGFPVINKDELNSFREMDNKRKRVICLVGQARMGKSFYLNCFNAYITNKYDNVFLVGSGEDHRTKGVNVYENSEYILIDCQGLKYEDSKGDDKLLLIAYTLSDIVIINCVKTLDNTALSYIEPISVYEHELKNTNKKKHKPVLVFKVLDYQMDENPDKAIRGQLTKLMTKCADNFQTLRNVLTLLFSNFYAIYTLPPDRKEKTELNKNNYKYALDNDELNIRNTIEYIMKLSNDMPCDSKITHREFMNECEKLANRFEILRSNKTFDIAEMDISKFTAEKRCENFLRSIKDDVIVNMNGDKIPNHYRSIIDVFKNLVINDSISRTTFTNEIEKITEILKRYDDEYEDNDPTITVGTLEKLVDHLFFHITPKLEELKNYITSRYNAIDVSNIISNFTFDYKNKINEYPKHKSTELCEDLVNLTQRIENHYKSIMAPFIYFPNSQHMEQKNDEIIEQNDNDNIEKQNNNYYNNYFRRNKNNANIFRKVLPDVLPTCEKTSQKNKRNANKHDNASLKTSQQIGETKRYAIELKLINNVLCGKVKNISEDVKEKCINIQNRLKYFLNLCNFDANVYFNKLCENVIEEGKKYMDCTTENDKIIFNVSKSIDVKISEMTNTEYILDFITSHAFDATNTFEINVCNRIKEKINLKLKEIAHSQTQLVIIDNLNVDLKKNIFKINYKLMAYDSSVNKKPFFAKFVESIDNFTNMYLPIFSQTDEPYKNIKFDEIFSNTKIKEKYYDIITAIISEKIINNGISYDEMIKIINANNDIAYRFVAFDKSEEYFHNSIREYFIPHNGYLFLSNAIAKNERPKMLGNITLEHIVTYYLTSDKKILIKWVSMPKSKDEIIKYGTQHKMAMDLATKYIK